MRMETIIKQQEIVALAMLQLKIPRLAKQEYLLVDINSKTA